jgi:hypothetical protein
MSTALKLHQAGRHEQVIALIEAALISGQPRGWMYQVLALTYKIQGRPAEDVERALLSDVDPNLEYSNIILTAAYLARFNDKAPALRMYRQAALQAPFRPEPYIMGLKIARSAHAGRAGSETEIEIVFRQPQRQKEQRHQRRRHRRNHQRVPDVGPDPRFVRFSFGVHREWSSSKGRNQP